MKLSELHSGLKEIDFTNGTSLVRDDWQASLECRGVYDIRSGKYLGQTREAGNSSQ